MKFQICRTTKKFLDGLDNNVVGSLVIKTIAVFENRQRVHLIWTKGDTYLLHLKMDICSETATRASQEYSCGSLENHTIPDGCRS